MKLAPQQALKYTHFSPLAGKPDKPQNYHTVTIQLAGDGERTRISLSQDGNANAEERDHSASNWAMMLEGLKTLVEKEGA